MNLSDLTTSEKIAGGGGVLLLVASFLPWYSFAGFGIIGWSSGFLAWGGILAGVAGAGILLAPRLGGKELSAGSLAGPQLAVVLTGLGTVLILLRILTVASFLSVGVFAGLAGAAVATYGSFRAMREAGMELPVEEMRERFSQSRPPSAETPPLSRPAEEEEEEEER